MEDENEAAYTSDFASYRFLIGLALIPALIVTLLLITVLKSVAAPVWTERLVQLLFVTAPLGAATWWVWNKPALRLPNGRVIARGQARRAMLGLWGLALAWFALRLVYTAWLAGS